MTRYANHPVHACDRVDIASFRVENLGFIAYLLRSNCGKLLDLGSEYYPQLVRMFYANIRTVKTGLTIALECQVKHTTFTLTESALNTILKLPTITHSPLSQTEARNRCLIEFTNSHSQNHLAHPSYLTLKQDPRLLYYIIARTLLPKHNSTDSVNSKTLVLIYLLMTRKPISYARYILRTMSKVGSVQDPTPLPYAPS